MDISQISLVHPAFLLARVCEEFFSLHLLTMSAAINNTLQTLVIQHQWLGKDAQKTKRLGALLAEALNFAGKDGVQLICQLIERFVYISNEEYDDFIMLMAEFIYENFDLNASILCATTGDRNKDSAQLILYDTISALAVLGGVKVKNVNRYDVAQKAFKEDPALRKIILIDEFVGTGKSILGRTRRLKQLFSQAKQEIPQIHFIGLAGMSAGLRVIEPHLSSVNVCISLVRGIGAYSSGQNVKQDYALMDKMESGLSKNFADTDLPSYGYEKSEALYSRKGGSCPNNVFPIFWWPELENLVRRNPLFPRAM